MKPIPAPRPAASRCFALRAFPSLAAAALASALAASAQTPAPVTWADAGTDFATGANWIGGTAPANDITTSLGSFNSTVTHEPVLASDRSIAGLLLATNNVTLSGAGTLTLGASGVENTQNTGSQNIVVNIVLGTASTFTNTGVTGNFFFNGALNNGGNLLTLTGGNGTGAAVINNTVSGSGGLLKTGDGTWRLTQNNTYTGGTVINGGSLVLNQNGALPAGGNVVISSTASGAASLTFNNPTPAQSLGSVTFGGGTTTSTSTMQLNSGTVTLGGDVTYDATNNPGAAIINGSATLALGGDRTFNIGNSTNAANDLSVSSPISGGTAALTKTGAGTLALSNSTNSWSGGTVVSGGSIAVNASGALSTGGALTIAAIGNATASVSLGTNVTQSISTLRLGGAGSTSTSINNLSLGSGATLTLGGNFTYDATGNPAPSTITGSGTLALGGDRTFDIGNSTTPGNEVTIQTPVSGGTAALTKTGAGVLNLSSPGNAWTGGTTVNNGTLVISGSGALPTGGAVTVNATSASSTATLQIGSTIAASISALKLGGASPTSTAHVAINGSGTLTLTGDLTYDPTNNPLGSTISGAGTLVLGGNVSFNVGNSTTSTFDLVVTTPISGGFSLTKTGDGVLRLNNPNSYSGGTIVSAGRLQVNNLTGSGVGTGPVDILSGASLRSNNGSLAGATTIEAGATLAPGSTNTPGTITFTNGLSLVASSITSFQIGSASDKVVVAGGQLTGPASGLITLNLVNDGSFGAGQYTLFDYSTGGTTTSNFAAADFVFGTTPSGYTYNLSDVGSTLVLTVTAVPEPATYAALLGVAALGLAIVRRRRKTAA